MIRKILIIGASMWLVILFVKSGGYYGQRKMELPLDSAGKAAIIRAGRNLHNIPLCVDQFVLLKNIS